MLGWFKGAPAAPSTNNASASGAQTPSKPQEYDDDYMSQTPAPMFAVSALRTAIFGTPAPKPRQPRQPPQQSRPLEEAPDLPQPAKKDGKAAAKKVQVTAEPSRQEKRPSAVEDPKPIREADDIAVPSSPTPFIISKRPTIFDRGATASASTELPSTVPDTPARPVSPTKGILRTPGATLVAGREKKAVNFHPSIEDEARPQKTRIRSGLPHEFPGKFPSPWTPRTGTPGMKGAPSNGSLEDTSKPIGQGRKRSPNFEVNEDSRIENILQEPDDDTEIPSIQDTDLTIDMAAPKSSSGQYWKETAESLEGLALTRLDRMRESRDIAMSYAQKKDEYCVNLAEKLREVTAKNQLFKDELKRRNELDNSGTGNARNLLADAMKLLTEREAMLTTSAQQVEQMQQVVEQYAARIKTYEEIIDSREERITELSMHMFEEEEGNHNEVVEDLKKKLRKARQESKESSVYRLENKDLTSKVDKLQREKVELEIQLERARQDVGNTTSSTIKPNVESRLRSQVEELEKAKRELRTELRAKTTEASREKREAERTFRADMTDMKARLVSVEIEKREMEREVERLQEVTAQLESALDGKSTQRVVSAGRDQEEWQAKHRATLQDLRRAREESSTLRVQKAEADEQMRQIRTEIRELKAQLGRMDETAPELPQPATTAARKPEEIKDIGSDDSAIDRTFDRTSDTRAGDRSARVRSRSRSKSPRKRTTFTPSSWSPETPQTAIQMPADDFMSLADPPELTPVQGNKESRDPQQQEQQERPPRENQTPEKTMDQSTFIRQRQQKASPRASMVNFAVTPPAGVRRASGVRVLGAKPKKVSVISAKWAAMDPDRRAAAAQRLAERNAAKKRGLRA